MNIFEDFCKYVDEQIFAVENIGSYVAMVIDQSFIDEFCRSHNTNERALMSSVYESLYKKEEHDILEIKGIVAIQLFAASKRANSDNITAQNYYNRLSQVMNNWDISELQEQWMPKYQEKIWDSLYRWCDEHYFQITKRERRTGTWRYAQYPLDQAKKVFTAEDLKYIAKCFVDKNLYPGEDIQQKDFWRIIDKENVHEYFQTQHATTVVDNSNSEDDYYSQIFNYYLIWNGEYKKREKTTRIDSASNDVFAYITDDFSKLELRNSNLQLLHDFNLSNVEYNEVQKYFHFKRRGILLFKRDDIYDDHWQEVRYLEDDGNGNYSTLSGNYGLLVCFKAETDDWLIYKLKRFQVHETSTVLIYKITKRHSHITDEFFTTKRFYELYGGLKIGRHTYIKGAAPILRLTRDSMVWLDGKPIDENASSGNFPLNSLDKGTHFIKLPGTKKIEIEIVETTPNTRHWKQSYNTWNIKKKPAVWESAKHENGIAGLDFSSISCGSSISDTCITRRWAENFAFNKTYNSENNIAINLIRNDNGRI